MIPKKAVEAAAKVQYRPTGDIAVDADEWMTCCRDAQKALEAAAPHMLAEVTALVSALTDPEDCHFDHHGGCQAHGYLDLQSGEICPQRAAKEWTA